MEKKFKVIAIHPELGGCELSCSFCYKDKKPSPLAKDTFFWYRLIPYLSKLTDQIACIEENELVLKKVDNRILTERIGNVCIGDMILAKSGFNEVIKVIKKEVNEIIKLRLIGGKEILLTKDHLVPIKRFTNNRVSRRKEIEPILKKVEDIKLGDYLFYGCKVDTKLPDEIDLFDYTFKTDKGTRLKCNKDTIWIERSNINIPRFVKINDKFARLMGYYISEGFDRGFAFNKQERKRIEDCKICFKSVFGLDLNEIKNGENGLILEFRSRFVIPLFRHKLGLGKYAKNKQLGYALSLDEDLIPEFLCGLFGGDGWWYLSQDNRISNLNYYSFSYHLKSVSKKLIDELLFLFENRLGINASIYRSKGKPRNIKGREIKRYDSEFFSINILGLDNINLLKSVFKFDEDYEEKLNKFKICYKNRRYHKQPRKTKELKVIGYELLKGKFNVVDLVMKEEPYFVCSNNILVHNCGANGEPFMDSAFVARFANLCKKEGMLCNVTSNGRKLMEMSDELLKDTLRDITIVSLSFDKEKVKTVTDLLNYVKLVKRIKKLTKTQVGCNLLIDDSMFKNNGLPFILLCKTLFDKIRIDRLFVLYPKNVKCIDITKHKKVYQYLSIQYPKFFVDDLTKEIIEQGYIDWKNPCHFGQDLISINEKGLITGCSFDPDNKAIMEIRKPKDILNIQDRKFTKRYECPYLIK